MHGIKIIIHVARKNLTIKKILILSRKELIKPQNIQIQLSSNFYFISNHAFFDSG